MTESKTKPDTKLKSPVPFPGLTGKRLATLAALFARNGEEAGACVSRGVEIWNAAHAAVEAEKFSQWRFENLPQELSFQEIVNRKLLLALNGKDSITSANGVKKVVRKYLRFVRDKFVSTAEDYQLTDDQQRQWKRNVEAACNRIEQDAKITSKILLHVQRFQKEHHKTECPTKDELVLLAAPPVPLRRQPPD